MVITILELLARSPMDRSGANNPATVSSYSAAAEPRMVTPRFLDRLQPRHRERVVSSIKLLLRGRYHYEGLPS